MLKGGALSYFLKNMETYSTNEGEIHMLRQWYDREENNSRLLSACQSKNLTKYIHGFRQGYLFTFSKNSGRHGGSPYPILSCRLSKFVSKLMYNKIQLYTRYHTYSFLRVRVLKTVYITTILITFRYHLPRTSQQAVNIISNQIYDKPDSAGSASAGIKEVKN